MSWHTGWWVLAPGASMRIEKIFPSGIYSPSVGRQTGLNVGPQFAVATPSPWWPEQGYVELRVEAYDLANHWVRDDQGDWDYDWVYHFAVSNIGQIWADFGLDGGGVT